MKFANFKSKVQQYPLFRSAIFPFLTDDPATLRRQVSEWCKKGYLLQLKRGVYTIPLEDGTLKFSRYFLANQLYSPSYVSLESALSFYNMIPEAVHAITSVTTKKTQRFENTYGSFQYHHIKPNLYSDYLTAIDERDLKFFIATKERALIDFFYFKARELKSFDHNVFQENFRLQNYEDIDKKKLLQITGMFSQKKLLNLVELFLSQME